MLDRVLAADGGFDHNRQTLRIVDWLEERYPGFRGLNLSWETREGILKHGCDWEHPVPVPERGAQPSLEAQVADHADEIAYLSHDLDDGLRSGLLDWEQLEGVALWAEARSALPAAAKQASERVLRAQLIRALLNHLVTELARESAPGDRLDQPAVGHHRRAGAGLALGYFLGRRVNRLLAERYRLQQLILKFMDIGLVAGIMAGMFIGGFLAR